MFSADGSMPTTRRAHTGQRLGDEAGAAADIENAKAGEGVGGLGVAAEAGADCVLDTGEAGSG